ncbi:MAG: hypothetical protein ABJD97_18340 [Betaproteobacteria bacterium]
MAWWRRLFDKETPSAPTPTPAPAPSPAAAAHPAIDERAAREWRWDSPEFDDAVAGHELESGDNLPHGAQHLANLLLVDPRHPAWRALLDRYVVAAAPALDALAPDVDPRHASTEALRAWIWQVQGRHAEALDRLVDVAGALGDADLLHAWALDWLEPEGAIEALPEPSGLALFGALLTMCGEAPNASANQLAWLRRWAVLLERVAPRWAGSSLLLMMRAGLQRKSGHFDAALALAGAVDQAIDFNRITAIGLAQRAQGLFAESARTFEHGADIDPGNLPAFLEAGDSWTSAACWPEALAAYNAALALQPGQEWAEPSAWYCQWKIDGDEARQIRLAEASQAGNRRAHALLFREFGAIRESGDATAGALRQLRASWLAKPPGAIAGGISAMTVSTIGAPSACLAIQLELAAFGQDSSFAVSYESIPALDPRVAIAEVKYPLWAYDGLRATPALAPPAAATTARIARLASARYDPHDNWAQASHVAAALGPAFAADVLAVMVHPPAVPAGTHALAWLPRVQLAAAMVAGQLDAGWQGTERRAALTSLLFGPLDWTTGAGIRVLGWIARAEPAHAQDIHRLFEQRERHMPTEGHWDWIETLYTEWATLPWLTDGERAALKDKLQALD